MDILSHGLWAAAGAHGSSRLGSSNKRVHPWWAFFWGMFPDLFAFTVPFIALLWNILTGGMAVGDWPRPEQGEPPTAHQWPGLLLASTLYQYSHSLIIVLIVAVALLLYCYLRKKRFPLEMLGWPLHILLDIPTHTYQFFPTPALWPLSQWKFDGYSWAHPVFMVANYSALIIVFLVLRKRKSASS